MRLFFIGTFLFMLLCGCKDRLSDKMLNKISRSELITYAEAVNLLAADCGKKKVLEVEMPELLDALYRNPGWPGWKGPYLEGVNISHDAWGTPYKFERSGLTIRIVSGGPDRKMGTGDDIVVVAQMPGFTSPDRPVMEK